MLRDQWAVQADVWSVTSWTQLRREALATDEWNYLHPQEPHKTPVVTARLHGRRGPVVAVSDWMRAVPDQIAPFVHGDWSSLGTDGFGMSDTRAALRRHFRVDPQSIVLRVLERLAHLELVDRARPAEAIGDTASVWKSTRDSTTGRVDDESCKQRRTGVRCVARPNRWMRRGHDQRPDRRLRPSQLPMEQPRFDTCHLATDDHVDCVGRTRRIGRTRVHVAP